MYPLLTFTGRFVMFTVLLACVKVKCMQGSETATLAAILLTGKFWTTSPTVQTLRRVIYTCTSVLDTISAWKRQWHYGYQSKQQVSLKRIFKIFARYNTSLMKHGNYVGNGEIYLESENKLGFLRFSFLYILFSTGSYFLRHNKKSPSYLSIYTYMHTYRVFLKGLYKIVGGIVDMKINIIK